MQRYAPRSRGTLLIAGLVVAAAATAYWYLRPPGVSPAAPDSSAEATLGQPIAAVAAAVPEQPSSDDAELQPLASSEKFPGPRLPAVMQPTSRIPPAAQPTPTPPPRSEPTPYTRQLVWGLTNLDLSHAPISREQAEQWKLSLAALRSQGTAAVPAIREFLELNQELNFTAVSGGDLLGESSLRSALINALAQIGGPEASALMLQTLQMTTLPSEIAQIAQYLEQQAPGQYRQETLNAVNEVLAMSSKGELPGWDVGPLFKVLQTYGDGATASALARLEGSWKYYATMSLAGLQEGEGVPVLIGEVRDASAGGKRDFAYQMLAQVASQYPEASTALLEQARANQIPDVTWPKLATGLAGDQYQLGAPPSPGGPDAPPLPGLKTYHVESGNQNFYSLPLAPDGQVQQRLALIDQLLSATGNPAAVTALQGARATLSSLVPK